MRIHTDVLTRHDLADAFRTAGVTPIHATEHGSRSRSRAFEIALTGTSAYRTQWGGRSDQPAATWDEWGIVLGVLFDRDPRMIAGGPNGYVGKVDYDWQTGGRFARDLGPWTLTPAGQHRRHRWDRSGESVTGSYVVHECRCGAVSRRLLGVTTRADLDLDVPELATA